MTKKLNFMLMISVTLSTMSYSKSDFELLIPSPTSNQLVSLDFIDENTGWAVGESGTIVKTVDGGLNWRIIEVPWELELFDVNFLIIDIKICAKLSNIRHFSESSCF